MNTCAAPRAAHAHIRIAIHWGIVARAGAQKIGAKIAKGRGGEQKRLRRLTRRDQRRDRSSRALGFMCVCACAGARGADKSAGPSSPPFLSRHPQVSSRSAGPSFAGALSFFQSSSSSLAHGRIVAAASCFAHRLCGRHEAEVGRKQTIDTDTARAARARFASCRFLFADALLFLPHSARAAAIFFFLIPLYCFSPFATPLRFAAFVLLCLSSRWMPRRLAMRARPSGDFTRETSSRV